GTKVNKKEREGEILFNHKIRKFYIKKGDDVLGYYDSMTEAFYYKKMLMDNNWDMNVLKSHITERIEVNIIIDQTKEYKVQLKFCPKCKSRLKIGEEECPSCGINIKDYLYKNN
ncbi:MAG: zinc ribbon domain-containing protein, partial [Methanobrevibacter sp.]|nr:zinc ribbon domain-containing protein [Methanobrevibacter sp.]